MLEVTGDSPPQAPPCHQLRTALPRMHQSQQEGRPGPGLAPVDHSLCCHHQGSLGITWTPDARPGSQEARLAQPEEL